MAVYSNRERSRFYVNALAPISSKYPHSAFVLTPPRYRFFYYAVCLVLVIAVAFWVTVLLHATLTPHDFSLWRLPFVQAPIAIFVLCLLMMLWVRANPVEQVTFSNLVLCKSAGLVFVLALALMPALASACIILASRNGLVQYTPPLVAIAVCAALVSCFLFIRAVQIVWPPRRA
jgi:hypothetical protein